MDSALSVYPSIPGTEAARAPDIVELQPEECDQIMALAQEITVSPRQSPELFCRQSHRAARRLPDRLIELLHDFAGKGTGSGTMLFDGLPVEQAPPTPPDNRSHLGETTLLARAQAIVNHACGQMVAYEAEGYGCLYQDMVPNRAMATTQTSMGSRVELELHTEQAFSNLRPDVLSLACLRGNPEAQTYVLPAHTLIEHLTVFERELLRQKLWMTEVDPSFRLGGHDFLDGIERGPLPIIAGAEDDPTVCFDQDLMRGINEQAQEMVGRVTEIYQAHRHAHTLTPGQILLVDNVRSVHGRSPFSPAFDEHDRFIIRSFAVRDLVRSRYARPANGRMIAAQYS